MEFGQHDMPKTLATHSARRARVAALRDRRRYTAPTVATGPIANSGRSIILYTVAATTSGFQFVISDDQDWIIIEDRKDNPQTSCFFDRGADVFMRFNITVVQP